MTGTDKSVQFWNRLGTASALVIWGLLFWPVLTGVGEFGFRDSASLYQPLFEWTRNEWLAGKIPLWCSLDNWGAPVVADATSSVFYPGKIVFLFHFVPFSILFGIYASAHVLLAVFGTRWCAGRIGMSAPAQWMAAIAFGFGGSVLFQTCNVVFLVGASWLPWAIGCVWMFGQSGRFRHAIRLAVIMAMMILGGDPQMAFHVGMIAAIWWLGQAAIGRRMNQTRIPFRNALIGLFLTALLAFGLASIQILPSLEWAQTSERLANATDSSIGQAIQRPAPDSHRDAIYQFSLPPWNVIEMVWPNVLGKFDFGTNWRWSNALAGADRIWTGSLYSGMLVFLLALAMVFCRRKRAADVFLIGTAVVFLLGSFGWYGIGWLINELQLMRGGQGTGFLVGEPTGGLYWWLVWLVPGYSSFRYPAKLFVVASLAVCLLGARGFDRLTVNDSASDGLFDKTLSRILVTLFSVTAAALLFMAFGWNRDLSQLTGIDDQASRQIAWSLGRTMLLLVFFAAAIGPVVRKRFRRQSVVRVVMFVCAIELVLAISWTVCIVPTGDSLTASMIAEGNTVFRPTSMDDIQYYDDWNELQVQMDIDRQTLMPKHHLRSGHRLIGSYSSIQPTDLAILLRMINDRPQHQRDRVLQTLGVDACLEFGDKNRNSRNKVKTRVLDGEDPFYFTSRIECWAPIDARDTKAVTNRTNRFLDRFDIADNVIDKKSVVADLVEFDPPIEIPKSSLNSIASSVVSLEYSNNRIQLQVSTDQRGLLVTHEYYDENWQAWKLNEDGTRSGLAMIRVNRVHRGILTPAGDYQIEMVYRPAWFYRGFWISFLTWALLACWWIRDSRHR